MSASGLLLLAVLQSSAPYVRSHTSADAGSHCLWWGTPDITYVQSSLGNPAAGASAFTAVSTGFLAWGDVMRRCGNLSFTEGPRTSSRKVGGQTNLVIFRTTSCAKKVLATNACWAAGTCANAYDCWDHSSALLGVTTVSYNTATGELLHADIELDAADNVFTTVNSPVCTTKASQTCVASDVQNTVTHEIGHLLGLGHTSAPNSTMNATASIGETSKRNIDPGTASFVCEVYTHGLGTKDCVVTPDSDVLGAAAAEQAGCSASGGPLLGWLAGLVLLTLLRRRGLRAALPLALLAVTAQATTLLALDLDALTTTSDVVAQARVRRTSARWTADHARIVTEVELEVVEAWKGAPARLITVTQLGGEVGEVGQHVEGIARFEAGEEVVVFLEARGAQFTVSGLEQGKFHLERGADGTLTASQGTSDARYVDLLTHEAVVRAPVISSLAALKQRVVGAANQSLPPLGR